MKLDKLFLLLFTLVITSKCSTQKADKEYKSDGNSNSPECFDFDVSKLTQRGLNNPRGEKYNSGLPDSVWDRAKGFEEITHWGKYQTLTLLCKLKSQFLKGEVIGIQVHNGEESYIYLLTKCGSNGRDSLMLLSKMTESPHSFGLIKSRLVNDSTIIFSRILKYRLGEAPYKDSVRQVWRLDIRCGLS